MELSALAGDNTTAFPLWLKSVSFIMNNSYYFKYYTEMDLNHFSWRYTLKDPRGSFGTPWCLPVTARGPEIMHYSSRFSRFDPLFEPKVVWFLKILNKIYCTPNKSLKNSNSIKKVKQYDNLRIMHGSESFLNP